MADVAADTDEVLAAHNPEEVEPGMADTFGLTEADDNTYQQEDPYADKVLHERFQSYNYLPELNHANAGLKGKPKQKDRNELRSHSNISNINKANTRRYTKTEN
jgi:hypothetical protein